MKVLLDTPLISGLLHSHPEDWIARWIDAYNEEDVYLSGLTIGEIVHWIEAESQPEKKIANYRWLNEELLIRFHGKVIPLDLEILSEWGRVAAECQVADKPLSTMDAMMVATARVHKLVLITYNRDIFINLGIEVSDPWQG
jgi:toxin FitB